MLSPTVILWFVPVEQEGDMKKALEDGKRFLQNNF